MRSSNPSSSVQITSTLVLARPFCTCQALRSSLLHGKVWAETVEGDRRTFTRRSRAVHPSNDLATWLPSLLEYLKIRCRLEDLCETILTALTPFGFGDCRKKEEDGKCSTLSVEFDRCAHRSPLVHRHRDSDRLPDILGHRRLQFRLRYLPLSKKVMDVSGRLYVTPG